MRSPLRPRVPHCAEVTFPPARRHPPYCRHPENGTPPLPCGLPPRPCREHRWLQPSWVLPSSIRDAAHLRTPAFAMPSPYLRRCRLRRDGRLSAPPGLPRLSPALCLCVFRTEYAVSKTNPSIGLDASSQLIRLPVLLLLLNIARWLPALPEPADGKTPWSFGTAKGHRGGRAIRPQRDGLCQIPPAPLPYYIPPSM